MRAKADKHVAVIGAGIIGACAALELQKRNHRVTLIEPATPGGAQAASYGNGAMLSTASTIPMSVPGLWKKVPSYLLDQDGPLVVRWRDLPHLAGWMIRFLLAGCTTRRMERISNLNADLMRDGPERHQALAEEAGVPELIARNGIIYAWKSRKDFQAEAGYWALRASQGLEWEELEGKALRDAEPDLSPDYQFAVLVRSGGVCHDPGAYVRALTDLAVRRGADLVRARASGLSIRDGVVQGVTFADREALACDEVVISAGIHSRSLAAAAGDKVPLMAERGYHIELDEDVVAPRRPLMPMDGKMANTLLRRGLRASGQVELCRHDAPPNWRRADILRRHLQRTFPALNPDQAGRFWVGCRPSLPDCLPVISASAASKGVYYAFGHGHIGLSTGPKTASILADLMTSPTGRDDASPFSVTRFTG